MEGEILILSDDDDDTSHNTPTNTMTASPSKDKNWSSGMVPKITNVKTLNSSGSESGFSGFDRPEGSIYSNGRIYDDLEIVEEVIRDIMPGKCISKPCQRMPYRERKMGFNWLRKIKNEKQSLNHILIDGSSVVSENALENEIPKDDGIHSSSPVIKRRSFAAMRPSAPLRDKLSAPKDDNITRFRAMSPSTTSFATIPSPTLSEDLPERNNPMQEIVLEEGTSSENKKKQQDGNDKLAGRRSPSPTESLNADMRSPSPAVSSMSHEDDEVYIDEDEGSSKKKKKKKQDGNDERAASSSPVAKRHTRSSNAGRRSPSPSESLNANMRSPSPAKSLHADRRSPSPVKSLNGDRRSPSPAVSSMSHDNDQDEGSSKEKSDQDKGNSKEKKEKSRHPKKERVFSSIISSLDYGRFVWGKAGSSRPWPAVIVCHKDCGEIKPSENKAWLLWFGDYRITQVPLTNIKDFCKNFKSQYANTYHQKYKSAVLECLKECRERSGMKELPTKDSYIKWGETGMTGVTKTAPDIDLYCSAKIQRCLSRIRKMRMRENCSTSSEKSFFPTSSSVSSDECTEERGAWKPKASLLKDVRDGKHDIEKLCIACDRVKCEVVAPHPYFLGGTCTACKDELEDLSAIASDGTCMYCIICGSPGELIICDDADCERVFCTGCVELLVSPKAVEQIMNTDPWYCFLCEPYHIKTHGLLKPRPGWEEKVASNTAALKSSNDVPEVEDETPDISTFPRRPIRVLSLFDGIATGLYVLDKLGLDVEVYYASEIHESAKNVASLNFGSRITYVGDVQTFTDKKIAELCPIDLLIGGSPCNDLSFVNPNRKGLFDPAGTGILFFHYFRALKTIQALNKSAHLFWLFENVNHMPREFKTHINIFLQREPVVIDAKFFSPQSRPRCFWGNIPDMYKPLPPEVMAKHHPLSKCVTKVSQRAALAEKVNCITTNSNSLKQVFQMNDHADFPWITEIEKIFGFPPHYTDVGNLNLRERQALLGRSWSVAVIEHILKPLTKYFPSGPKKRCEPEEDSSKDKNIGPEFKKLKRSGRSK